MTFEIEKDPTNDEDYSIDWTTDLEESDPVDVIIESIWFSSTVPGNSDLTIDAVNNFLLPSGDDFLLPDGVSLLMLPSRYITDGVKTTVWVSGGGKLNTKHKLVNRVTTAGGRKWDRTIEVTMRSA